MRMESWQRVFLTAGSSLPVLLEACYGRPAQLNTVVLAILALAALDAASGFTWSDAPETPFGERLLDDLLLALIFTGMAYAAYLLGSYLGSALWAPLKAVINALFALDILGLLGFILLIRYSNAPEPVRTGSGE